MYNMNQVNWYKFEIDGKRAMVIATSVIGEIREDVRYLFISMV